MASRGVSIDRHPERARPRRLLGLAALVAMVAATATSLTFTLPTVGLTHIWLVDLVMAVVLAEVWGPHRLPRSARFWAVASGLAVVTAVTAATLTASLRTTVLTPVAGLFVSVGSLAIYRLWRGGTSWTLRTWGDVVRLMLATHLTTPIPAIMGLYPTQQFGRVTPAAMQLWWLRVDQGLLLGLLVWFIVRSRTRQRFRWRDAALALVISAMMVGSLWLMVSSPSQPLGWLSLPTAAAAGLALSPRWCSAIIAVMLTGRVAFETIRPFAFAFDGPPSQAAPVSLVDALITVAGLMCAVVAMSRQQIARAAAEAERQRQMAIEGAELLRVAFETMAEGVMLATHDRQVVLANRAVRRTLRWPPEGPPPSDWLNHIDARRISDGRPVGDHSIGQLARGELTSTDFRLGAPDSVESRVMHLSTQRVRQADQQMTLLLFHDITDQQAHEEQLTNFAGRAAHDLRSPLAAVTGWLAEATECLDEDDVEGVRTSVQRASVAAERMDRIINDWLEWTVARGAPIKPGIVALSEVMDEMAPALASEEGAPVLEVHAPDSVVADPVLVRRLMGNLVGNSIKYVAPGTRPHITVTTAPTAPGWVEVAVRDNGQGFGPGEEQEIFEAFRRGRGRSGTDGTGLGLSLCRWIVTCHGGQIWAASNPEGGATIAFTLPGVSGSEPDVPK